MSEENGRTDLTWRELLDEGGARLSEAGVPDAGTDAWYLMEYVLKQNGISDAGRSWYFLHCEEEMPEIRTVRSMRNAWKRAMGAIRKCFRNGQSAFHCSRFWECRILWE